MKKLISLIILILVITTNVPAQKVNFSFLNGRFESGTVLADLYATVGAGQNWVVGPTNVRVYYHIRNYMGGISASPENPVTNANVNLSNNASYYNMTSTSIMADTAISLNIQLLLGTSAYTLAGGSSYWLGTLKFSYTGPPDSCVLLNFLPISAVFDGWSPLTYTTGWTFTDPDPICVSIGITNHNTKIPSEYMLMQNYPNPFNPVTTIEFSMPKAGYVKLKVFDMLGRQVAELVNAHKSAGNYRVDFNASDLSTGIYFYRLEVNDFVAVKKLALIK